MLEMLAQAAHAAEPHAEATAFGLAPGAYVALAMLVVFAIMLWAGVPRIIAKILDDRIAAIRSQLDEAAKLRVEAAALRDEYAAKIAGAERDAEAMLASAQREADAILVKAETDSKAMVERRKRMAEDKIASAERDAIDEVRNRVVIAATAAGRKLIAEKHDAEADRALSDEVIAGI